MSTASEPTANDGFAQEESMFPSNAYMAPFVRVTYAVLQLSMLTLGIQLWLCFYSLAVYRRCSQDNRKRRKPFIIVSFVILALFILSHTMDSWVFADWVINSDLSFAEFIAADAEKPHWGQFVGTIANVLVTGVADAVLIYRCFVIWRDTRFQYAIVGLPLLAFVGSLGTGIGEIVQGRNPRAINLTAHLSSAYQGLSVLVTIFVTASISFRLLTERKRLVGLLGRKVTAKYTGATAILVESALPFTIFGVATVIMSTITIKLGDNTSTALTIATSVVDSLWYCSSALCPQVIMFRVTTGETYSNDWSDSMNQELSQLRFSPSEPKDNLTRTPATESTASGEV
ncbi:hypothetical protein NMY22_g19637 [Coprinellus aureogranulatus]|nr:hypothetical protein NMY22_g19637 [Coprinellus aureogranulatus]